MEKTGAQRERVIALLTAEGSLSQDAIRRVSRETGVPEADVYGTGRFYDLLVRPGARVCQGLTCKLVGADALHAQLNQRHWANCVGQCDRAPVALGDDLRVSHAGPRGAMR